MGNTPKQSYRPRSGSDQVAFCSIDPGGGLFWIIKDLVNVPKESKMVSLFSSQRWHNEEVDDWSFDRHGQSCTYKVFLNVAQIYKL